VLIALAMGGAAAPAPAADTHRGTTPATASTTASASTAASGVAAPCRPGRAPDRGPLKAERERIAAADDALRARSEALQLRGATLDLADMDAITAYNRDVATLQADAAANDRAWEAYQARLAKTNGAARDAARCGRLATGAKPAAPPQRVAPAPAPVPAAAPAATASSPPSAR
jgi:hypothetical protein